MEVKLRTNWNWVEDYFLTEAAKLGILLETPIDWDSVEFKGLMELLDRRDNG